jgi:histone H3/H4
MEMGFPGTANGAVAAGNGGGGAQPAAAIREQDRLMPIANVIRIMRRVLPPHAKISDDAKETIQECVSEYISFITGEANERCQREQRKTITAEDVLWAMSRLGFDDYVDPLSVYLHRFREFEGEARGGSLGIGIGGGGGARGEHHGHHHGGMLKTLGGTASMVPHAHEMQMHAAAMYGGTMPPPTPHHHAFLMPPHHAQYPQYEVYGAEHGMAAYYGGAYGPGNGGNGDGSGSSGNGGASTPPAANYEHQQHFGYKQ